MALRPCFSEGKSVKSVVLKAGSAPDTVQAFLAEKGCELGIWGLLVYEV